MGIGHSYVLHLYTRAKFQTDSVDIIAGLFYAGNWQVRILRGATRPRQPEACISMQHDCFRVPNDAARCLSDDSETNVAILF